MPHADAEPQELASEYAKRLFEAQIASDSINADFKTAEAELKAERDAALGPVRELIRAASAALWDVIEQYRGTLIAPKKKSFSTPTAIFQLRELSAKPKVVDADGVMKVARKLGVVKKVARPPRQEWKLDTEMFLEWLRKNPEHYELFAPFLEEPESGEGLTIKPNATYLVEHGKERISPPPVKVEKPRRPDQE